MSLRVFVISLVRSQDRRRRIREAATRCRLRDWEFFDALDGRHLSDAVLARYDDIATKKKIGRALALSEIACALSHSALYQKMLNENIQNAVILEDDAKISPDFVTLLGSGALERTNFNLILLHARKPRVFRLPFERLNERFALYRFVRAPTGAAAYYLTLEAAKALCEWTKTISHPADWPGPIHHSWRTACLYPFPIFPPPDDLGDSTLEIERQEVTFSSSSTINPASDFRRVLRKFRRLLSLTVLPCLFAPTIFGDTSELKEYILNKLLAILSVHFGRELNWIDPDFESEIEPISDTGTS